MPTQVIEYKCLLISPSDVSEERDALTELATLWNAQIGAGLGARVNLVRWESHAVPDMGTPAQEAINSQLVRDCDLGIAVFWSKLGTATAKHPSGSAEEIFELLQKGARVLVYFCNRPIPQSALYDDQFAKLKDLKETFQKQGLYAEFSDLANLKEQVQLHLTNVLSQLLAKDRGATDFIPSSGTLTAPTPDVRVQASPGFLKSTSPFFSGIKTYLTVTVQNHSPVMFFLNSIAFEMKDGRTMVPTMDDLTGEWFSKREIRPGESYTFYMDPERLREHADKFVCVRATDAIGRFYRSNSEYFPGIVQSLLRSLKTDGH